jgi:hypothetical protein
MDLHNLCFSIWYHNMLQSGKNQIHTFEFHRTLDIHRYIRSFIDTLYKIPNRYQNIFLSLLRYPTEKILNLFLHYLGSNVVKDRIL